MKNKEQLINIIYEDDDMLAIVKPSGILTIPDRYDYSLPSLSNILKKRYGQIFVVHRLDRDTSGIMLFAKNAESHKSLNDQFAEQEIKKIYHAVVTGHIFDDEINIDIPLGPDSTRKGLSRPTSRGKESLSILHVLERFRNSTLVEIDLVTGRHHQLRVHVASIGHPLLVDPDYGKEEMFLLSSIKRRFNLKKHSEEKPIISRITMHAYSITFTHPVTKEVMTFSADYQKDFYALLEVLRKYSSMK